MTAVREVFHSMTKIAEDFTGEFGLDLNAGKVSRVPATLQLMYYQVCSPSKHASFRTYPLGDDIDSALS